jgi:hypothetical protein
MSQQSLRHVDTRVPFADFPYARSILAQLVLCYGRRSND